MKEADDLPEGTSRVTCPRCGSPMNRHAEKLIYGTARLEKEEMIVEFQTCRNGECRYVLERPTAEAP